MQAPRRIDTHHHFIPPRYLAAVGAEAIGRTLVSGRAPEWTHGRTALLIRPSA